MIPVLGMEGARVVVLGLGRTGLAAARALEAGGATALCWDDSPEARAGAKATASAKPSGKGLGRRRLRGPAAVP